MKPSLDKTLDPWPHRMAMLLCCATFPLIWVGGLVTTYDAGMAVPDWPSTYGYNLFLYPWTTWVFGPWDLFIEHGHRLLGAVVGLITIAFVVVTWRRDERLWVRAAAVVALLLVILQGSLGGARVLMDDRQLAMVHGCLGPAFFAYCAGLSVCLSPVWRLAPLEVAGDRDARLKRLTLITAVLAYSQLLLGAQLRHAPATASPLLFRAFVWFHLLVALALAIHAILLFVNTRRVAKLASPAMLLTILIAGQLGLGMGTWVLKYGWPAWLGNQSFAAHYVVQAQTLLQSVVVTGHVAVGSLILATTVFMSVRSFRLFRSQAAAVGSGTLLMGVAS